MSPVQADRGAQKPGQFFIGLSRSDIQSCTDSYRVLHIGWRTFFCREKIAENCA
jgi:hypothetical protein